jgi:hypothetical protein
MGDKKIKKAGKYVWMAFLIPLVLGLHVVLLPHDYGRILLNASRCGRAATLSIAQMELSSIEKRAYDLLIAGASPLSFPSESRALGSHFDDVMVSWPLPAAIIHSSAGIEGGKFFIAPTMLEQRKCTVYAAGLNEQTSFEDTLSNQVGCEVHGFDCTLLAPNPAWNFTFHDVCIGKPHGFDGNEYSLAKMNSDLKFEFKGLDDIRSELGHKRIDIFKMDVEGSEWEIISGLLKLRDEDLPEQLLFELHTEGANPMCVPPSLVKGKTHQAVAGLFWNLYNKGYRVVHKEINPEDAFCADFTLLRVG